MRVFAAVRLTVSQPNRLLGPGPDEPCRLINWAFFISCWRTKLDIRERENRVMLFLRG